MAFGDCRTLGDLQVEIYLEAVAQTTGTESMETFGARGRKDVFTEVVQHVRSRRGIEEILAGAFE
jgi:hypothetical protein